MLLKMSQTRAKCPRQRLKMFQTREENDLETQNFNIILDNTSKGVKEKKNKRKQGIIGMMISNSKITIETLADKLDVSKKTIKRDISELQQHGIIKREGGDFGGRWVVLK